MTKFIEIDSKNILAAGLRCRVQIPYSHEFVEKHTGPIKFSRYHTFLQERMRFNKLSSTDFILDNTADYINSDEMIREQRERAIFLTYILDRLPRTTTSLKIIDDYGTGNPRSLANFIMSVSRLQSLTITKECYARHSGDHERARYLLEAFNTHKSITHLSIGDIFCWCNQVHTGTLLSNYHHIVSLELTDEYYGECGFYQRELTPILATMSSLQSLTIHASRNIEWKSLNQIITIMTNTNLRALSISPLTSWRDSRDSRDYNDAFDMFMRSIPSHITHLAFPKTAYNEHTLACLQNKNLRSFNTQYLVSFDDKLFNDTYDAIKQSRLRCFPILEAHHPLFRPLLEYKRQTDPQTVHKILIDLGIVFFKQCLLQPHVIVEIFIYAYDQSQYVDRKFIVATLTKLYSRINRE